MINDLPTVFEVVTGAAKKQTKEKSLVSNHSGSKSKSNSKRGSEPLPKYSKAVPSKDEDDDGLEEEEEEHGETLCGACGESDGADEFWICCDICEKWFHGKSVALALNSVILESANCLEAHVAKLFKLFPENHCSSCRRKGDLTFV
ncbi:hypothetical protein Goarm_008040 [Gossypium armourianum]|uniref:PHD finger protein ALFIN-LIKE n=1 Tax=Gossypium armourianum TaxID=34283 RepID=A0A7J9JNN3_9ROSI|nr:hypothetical protein [Gossypium armourianum]